MHVLLRVAWVASRVRGLSVDGVSEMRDVHQVFFKRAFGLKLAQLSQWPLIFSCTVINLLHFRVFLKCLVILDEPVLSDLSKRFPSGGQCIELGWNYLLVKDPSSHLSLTEDLHEIGKVSEDLRKFNLLLGLLRCQLTMPLLLDFFYFLLQLVLPVMKATQED